MNSHSQTHAGLEGSVTKIHLPDGVTQRIRYDGEKRRASVTDGEGKSTRYVYGEFDLLLAVIRPDGQTLRFDYDSLTRLKQVTRPYVETYRFERDAAGQVISETDFTGRRTEARHPDNRIIRWHYSLRDELMRQEIWQGTETRSTLLATTRYAWDTQGRMVQAQNTDYRSVSRKSSQRDEW